MPEIGCLGFLFPKQKAYLLKGKFEFEQASQNLWFSVCIKSGIGRGWIRIYIQDHHKTNKSSSDVRTNLFPIYSSSFGLVSWFDNSCNLPHKSEVLSFFTPTLLFINWQEANDSRTFGPVPMSDIVGRVIYCLRTAVDHGPVQNRLAPLLCRLLYKRSAEVFLWLNEFCYLTDWVLCWFTSYFSMRKDSPVLEVELDVDEMAKNHKAWKKQVIIWSVCNQSISFCQFFIADELQIFQWIWGYLSSNWVLIFVYYRSMKMACNHP